MVKLNPQAVNTSVLQAAQPPSPLILEFISKQSEGIPGNIITMGPNNQEGWSGWGVG